MGKLSYSDKIYSFLAKDANLSFWDQFLECDSTVAYLE